MSDHPFEDAYDTIGSLGSMICLLTETVCGLAQDREFNLVKKEHTPLTDTQIQNNLDLDALALIFTLLRVGIKIPYKAGRHKESFPYEFALWALGGVSLLRGGISVGTRSSVPGGTLVVNKVLGGVEVAEGIARLVLQCIISGFTLDTSDIEDEDERTRVLASEFLRLFGNIFFAIGGACAGGSQFTPEPSTKGTLKVIGLGGKGLFAIMNGVEAFVDHFKNLEEFASDPAAAFKKLNDSLPWT